MKTLRKGPDLKRIRINKNRIKEKEDYLISTVAASSQLVIIKFKESVSI
jgi:hypothetical protein